MARMLPGHNAIRSLRSAHALMHQAKRSMGEGGFVESQKDCDQIIAALAIMLGLEPEPNVKTKPPKKQLAAGGPAAVPPIPPVSEKDPQ